MSAPPRRPGVRIAALLVASALPALAIAWWLRPSTPRGRGPAVPAHRGHLPEWRMRHTSNVRLALAGPVRLLFLGDSITAGWFGPVFKPHEKEGPAALWEARYGHRDAANFGIGGDQVEHLLWRLQNGELWRIRPEVAVLLIGTNNIGLDPPAAIAEGVAAVIAEIHRHSPETQILLLGLFPRGLTAGHGRLPYSESPDPRIAEINSLLAPLGQRPRVTYMDLGPRLLGPNGRLDRAIQPDLLHLSLRGYEIWADAIEPWLTSILEKPGG